MKKFFDENFNLQNESYFPMSSAIRAAERAGDPGDGSRMEILKLVVGNSPPRQLSVYYAMRLIVSESTPAYLEEIERLVGELPPVTKTLDSLFGRVLATNNAELIKAMIDAGRTQVPPRPPGIRLGNASTTTGTRSFYVDAPPPLIAAFSGPGAFAYTGRLDDHSVSGLGDPDLAERLMEAWRPKSCRASSAGGSGRRTTFWKP